MRVVLDTNAIVSGDQHLLRLAKYEGMRILTPAEAVKIIGSP
jgi:predicted nucleic acid-binding protein